MRRVREYTRQIQTREVEILVQIQPPFGAIGHVIDDASVGNILTGASVASIAAQFLFCDHLVGDVHRADYTRVRRNKKEGCSLWNCTLLVLENSTSLGQPA